MVEAEMAVVQFGLLVDERQAEAGSVAARPVATHEPAFHGVASEPIDRSTPLTALRTP